MLSNQLVIGGIKPKNQSSVRTGCSPNRSSSVLPLVDDASNTSTTSVRRKIIPSVDLLRDCYSTESIEVNVDPTSRSGETSAGGDNWTSVDESTAASVKTPDSLATQDVFDDSVFDGELDWIGRSNTVLDIDFQT